jgi:hypothetical protein
VGIFSRDETPKTSSSRSKEVVPSSSLFTSASGTTPAKSVAYSTPRSLTAAAVQIKIKDLQEFEQFKSRRSSASSAWQSEAWEYYDAIGEIKYAFNLVASVISRIRIYAAAVDDPSESPSPVSKAENIDPRLASASERALERLNSAYGGQAGLLRDAALNLSVTGECYLVQIPERPGTGLPETWDIKSTDELITDARGNFSVIGRREQNSTSGSGMTPVGKGISLTDRSFVGRIWRSHPRFSDEADSSLRGLLDLCLAEGTLVYTPKGAVPIESVSAGDLVYSRNPDSGELVQSMASRVWSTGVKPVYKVSSRGRSIRATGNHPVLVLRDSNPGTKKGVSAKYELSYVRVDELSKGDMLISFETAGTSNRRGDLPMRRNKSARELLSLDQPFVVSSVKSIFPDGEATVWDMTVPDTENFIADGLVVHNCAELLLLNRTFRATARSRLNAGALYLPDGLSVAAQGDGDFPLDYDSEIDPVSFTPEEAEDEFEEQLIDAMTTPIRDEESASAVVPLIIRGPAELGDAIKQFKFERSFDPALAQRADRVLERILQGLDVPKDVVTGLANVKYSNALQIDESLYKAHIEPLMLLLVDSLTVVYLRPYLIANGFDENEVKKLVVWYDPSAVATRNDRAADADAGFDRNAVSYNAWRRAHGFSDADAPDAKELTIRMLFERGVMTPELTESLLTTLAPEVMLGVRATQQATSVAPVPPGIQEAAGGEGTTPPPPPPAEEEQEVPSNLFEPGQ